MSGDTAPSALDALSQMLNQRRLPQALLVAARLSPLAPQGEGPGVRPVTHTPRRSPHMRTRVICL